MYEARLPGLRRRRPPPGRGTQNGGSSAPRYHSFLGPRSASLAARLATRGSGKPAPFAFPPASPARYRGIVDPAMSRAYSRTAIPALLLVAALAGSLAAERLARAAEKPAAPVPTAPSLPSLPAGATPLPPALAARMQDLRRAAEEYRGLRFQREVPAVALGGRALRKVTAQEFAEELPPERMRSLAAALKAFGFVPEDLDVGRYYPELVASQQAAFYDPDRKYLAVVELGAGGREAGRGPAGGKNQRQGLDKALGPDLARRTEEAVLVHELTHALDDQSFDLHRLGKTLPLADGGAALLGLIEGDATVTMIDYMMQTRVEELPAFGDPLGSLMRDPGALASLSPDMPGSKEMAAAPAWFRDTLLFSYFQGFAFSLDVRRQGGQKLLDYAFAHDPARSSEQLLHPEKWYGKRDDPMAIAWPDLGAELPGYEKTADGDLGEEGIAILLRQD